MTLFETRMPNNLDAPLRIAMWSGPRNISTAMMRSFENRPDCVVVDEPFYGAWLERTGEAHPMANEIIDAMDCDWQSVMADLTGPIPEGAAIWYQKHMTHHLLEDMIQPRWLDKLHHVFLIRDPRAVVASYLAKRDTVSAADIGIPQQTKLFDQLCELNGAAPPVIDSNAFLNDPEGHLRALCEALSIKFDSAMLNWPAGPRDSDGIWASHWYGTVWSSTRFRPPSTSRPELTGSALAVAESCRASYQRLFSYRLRP